MTCPRCGGGIVRRRTSRRLLDYPKIRRATFRDICGDCGWPDPLRPGAGDLTCDVENSLMGRRWTAR